MSTHKHTLSGHTHLCRARCARAEPTRHIPSSSMGTWESPPGTDPDVHTHLQEPSPYVGRTLTLPREHTHSPQASSIAAAADTDTHSVDHRRHPRAHTESDTRVPSSKQAATRIPDTHSRTHPTHATAALTSPSGMTASGGSSDIPSLHGNPLAGPPRLPGHRYHCRVRR